MERGCQALLSSVGNPGHAGRGKQAREAFIGRFLVFMNSPDRFEDPERKCFHTKKKRKEKKAKNYLS